MNKVMTATGTVDLQRRELALGLAATLLGLPLSARGAATRLTLAVIEQMPWASTRNDGTQSGILVDTARVLSGLSDIALQLRPLPYPRGAMMLKQRQVDLMVALQADQLDRVATRLAPLSMEDIVVVGRPGLTLHTLADLNGKLVGRLRNAEYASAFAASAGIRKYDTNSYRQSVQMLRIGRLDAVIFIRSALMFTLKSMQLDAAAVGQPLLIGRTPLTMYATAACAATSAGDAIREACKIVYKRQTVKALAELLNTDTADSPAILSWRT